VKALQIDDGTHIFLSNDVFDMLRYDVWVRSGLKIVRESDGLAIEHVASRHRRDQAERLAALGALDQAVVRHRLEGASASAIAEEMNQPVGLVLDRLSQAKNVLPQEVAAKL
jgi:hypothetical protein